ncbi:MAG: penicillin-binding transpeptidase domain-containing protein [Patulibacter sp.]
MGLTGIVLVVGALKLAGGDDRIAVATRFGAAYANGNYTALYALISASDRRHLSVGRFAELQQSARETATVNRITTGTPAKSDGDRVELPVRVDTELFGTLRGTLLLPIVKDGEATAIDWSQALTFPGLRSGEQLRRTTTLPKRASILASDGTVLVSGPSGKRTPTTDVALASIVGQMGPIPADQRSQYAAEGVPADAFVGTTGLERIFEQRVRGTPGGTLYAGTRELASVQPQAASAVRSTIVPAIQRAAVTGLGARIGGVAVVRPGSGAILALAGAAFSGLQPPGSTFKIITATAALRYGNAKLSSSYPAQTSTTLSGVELQNADGESCGGTLVQSFAHSCNSVFAPLGAKVGGPHLVATAEAFGFNKELGIPGAAISSIPRADDLGTDDLVVGSTAIGQGQVQATALQMALVAATIAERGERPVLTLTKGASAKRVRVIPRQVASAVTTMMAAVVSVGTGAAAKIEGVKVAGKTGTAELRSTQGACDPDSPPAGGCPDADDASDTTAWFAGFAPAGSPRVAVAVQLPGQGKGGDTAAPIFREVTTAALKAR